jgi:hypothetical protein
MMALDFEHIVKRTLTVLAANAVPFGLAAIVLVGLPSYLLKGDMLDHAVLAKGFDAGWDLSGLILMAAQIILSAFVMYGTEQHVRGAHVSFEPALRRGIDVVLSVWLTTLLLWAIFSLGKLMFIIPYFIARMILFVTIPVAVLEKTGPLHALSRSRELTRGHRWALLGYTIMLWVLGLLAGWIVHILLDIVDLGDIASMITIALIAAFDAVAVTIIYNDLRAQKDGVDTTTVAKVFE